MKNNLISLLSGAVLLGSSGCCGSLPQVEEGKVQSVPQEERKEQKPDYCETVELKDGKYKGVIVNGKEVEYEVERNGERCYLWIGTSNTDLVSDWDCNVSDWDCNNTVDGVFGSIYHSRKQLEQLGYAKQFDGLLAEAQKIVCLKNKIPRDRNQELEDLLKPYL